MKTRASWRAVWPLIAPTLVVVACGARTDPLLGGPVVQPDSGGGDAAEDAFVDSPVDTAIDSFVDALPQDAINDALQRGLEHRHRGPGVRSHGGQRRPQPQWRRLQRRRSLRSRVARVHRRCGRRDPRPERLHGRAPRERSAAVLHEPAVLRRLQRLRDRDDHRRELQLEHVHHRLRPDGRYVQRRLRLRQLRLPGALHVLMHGGPDHGGVLCCRD